MELLLSGLAALLFFFFYYEDLRLELTTGDSFFKSAVFLNSVGILVVVFGSLYLVNGVIGNAIIGLPKELFFVFSILLSGLISWVWISYIRSIDIYEPERKKYLLIVFVLACLSIWLVFPISTAINKLGFFLNGNGINDFLYATIGIGMVEEFVKLLPLFFIVRFTNQINEPIDYIVYGSVSALGFAFIENILYLQSTELTALSARLLYSSVAHMFFTSIVMYGLALDYVKKLKPNALHFATFFVLASLAHGFYDFWLINEAFYLPFMTTVFFIVSLHMWVLFKNNLINQSNFFDRNIKMYKKKLKYNLILRLVFVIYLGYILVALMSGSAQANNLLLSSIVNFLFLVVYITIMFSRYTIIPKYFAPISLVPQINIYPNFENLNITILFGRSADRSLKRQMEGKLVKRIVVENDINWYLFEETGNLQQFLIKPLNFDLFEKGEPKKLKICQLKRMVLLDTVQVKERDFNHCKMAIAYLSE